MAAFTQTERLLHVTTPLGSDVVLLTAFSGRETMSRLFSYHLELFSEEQQIDPTQIVGKNVTWSVQRLHQQPRFFNGFVSRFSAGGREIRKLRSYRAEVVPWLWFLTRTANCRIFQNKTAPDIIKAIFDGLGLTDYKFQLRSSYVKREYCVQYRETAFNFVSRLMEEEGIFYFFQHEEGKHTLVLADQKTAYQDCAESHVDFSAGSRATNHITSWDHQYEFRTGKWAQIDYNFETPSTSLLTDSKTVLKVPGMDKFEVFDYPGDYGVKADGTAETKVRMEEEEAGYETVTGAGQCVSFTPGGKFTLATHEIDAEAGKSYVLTSVQHIGTDYSHVDDNRGSAYSNAFMCIPDSVVFRPVRQTPKSIVQGPQTAVVVGPGGEEIYTDKYGRVKVQFFWDREGKKDENSSCWMRVAEVWAGKNWGMVFNPRIGQEVIVDFLEGDPDRPLITGRVYNAEQMPPYALPANQTQSGVKSRSSKGGSAANYNELRFEDKKGSELITLHAEKDQSIEVEHDETHWVGNDRTKNIDHDETSHIKHDRTETVDNNETITIHGQRTETVDKDETITIHGNRTETVDKNETITIHGGRTETVDQDENITIKGGRTENVTKDENITITGGRTESVQNDENITINGGRTENVKNAENITIGGGRTVNITGDDSLTISENLTISAGKSITITTGKASITMESGGAITISGSDITINGTGEIVGKATGNMTLKGSKVLQN